MFRNDGPAGFVDVTPPAIAAAYGDSVAWADYDNDGRIDLFIASRGREGEGGRGSLFRNEGSGTFTDMAEGLLGAFYTKAVWGDFDNDGWVDLFLAKEGASLRLSPNTLMRNVGGHFDDATTPTLNEPLAAQSGVWGDYDNDSDLDLFVVNDSTNDAPSRLFRNDGAGVFTDVTLDSLGIARGVAAAWADYDNDGDLDLLVASSWKDPCRLFRNDDQTLVEVASPLVPDLGAVDGAAWGDYDNDGDLDLFLARVHQPNQLLRNDGTNGFRDVTPAALAVTAISTSAAWGDYDTDGDLDLYVSAWMGGTKHLYRNDLSPGNHWLQLDLEGTRSNRSAIGARVTVTTGGQTQTREISGGGGSASQDALMVHFGLGAGLTVDSLLIRWPSGTLQTLTGVIVDQRLHVIESGPTNQPPVISSQPAGTSVYPGEDVRLRVSASGTWPLAYQWRKDGVDLWNSTNATLVLTNVSLANAGDYTVVVSNEFGSVASQVARITVNGVPPDSLTKGLVGYWPFDEGQGNVVHDLSGHGNHGQVQPGAGWTEGNIGGALDFSGEPDSFVRVPTADSLNVTTGLSVCAWVKSRTTDGERVIASKWDDSAAEWSFIFKDFNTSDKLSIELSRDHHNDLVFLQGHRPIIVGEWMQTVATFDAATQTVRLYVNGELDTEGPSSGGEIRTCLADFLVGAGGGSDGQVWEHFDGLIDDVRVFNRALSPDEIAALYYLQPTGALPEHMEIRTRLAVVKTLPPVQHGALRAIATSGTRALVSVGDATVALLDLKDPSNPVWLGSWEPLFPPSAFTLAGNTAYIASYEPDFLSTVEIVDFTDPAKPVLKGYYDTEGYALDLAVVGNRLYVADDVAGLAIVDLSNPARPARIGGYSTKRSFQRVEVSGRYAYVVDGDWLLILDVSEPGFPFRVGLYDLGGPVQALQVNWQTAYVLVGAGELRILDVSDPGNVLLLGTHRTWGVQSMAVAGKYAYLAKGNRGSEVVDLTDPAKPIWATGLTTTGSSEDVAVVGQNVVVAGGDKGLFLYRLVQQIYPPLAPPVVSDGLLTLTWPAMDGVRLQRTTELAPAKWEDVAESEGTNTVRLPMSGVTGFFRLVIGLPSFAETYNVTIPGYCNIYGAGHAVAPDPRGGQPGVVPVEVPLLAATKRVVTFSMVTGLTLHNPGVPSIGPDGAYHLDNYAGTFITSYGGLSGINADRMRFLTGVFLDDQEPSNPAPETLDFSGAGADFSVLSPELRQIFFIGDGKTSSNALQSFEVPDGASRLFLGFACAWDWAGEPGAAGLAVGALSVSLNVEGLGHSSVGPR